MDVLTRHHMLVMAGVETRAFVPPDDDELDEVSAALVDALERLDGETRGKPPLRIPKGFEGGGRFRSISDTIFKALRDWAKGDGPDNPFEGMKGLSDDPKKRREQLRKAAVARGITLRRGASENEIANALLADARKGEGDDRDVPDADEPDAKPKAPAKKATPRAPAKKASPPEPSREERVDADVRAAIVGLTGRTDLPSPGATLQGNRDYGGGGGGIDYHQTMREGGWVWLADIRDELGEKYSRVEVDAALKRLLREDGVRGIPVTYASVLAQRDRDSRLARGDKGIDVFRIDNPTPDPESAARQRQADIDSAVVEEVGEPGDDIDIAPAASAGIAGTQRMGPKDLRSGDVIVTTHRDYDARGQLGPPYYTEQVVGRVDPVKRGRVTEYALYAPDGSQVRMFAANKKLDVRRSSTERFADLGNLDETPDPLSSLRTLDPEAARDALDLKKVDDLKALIRQANERDGVKLPVSGRKRDLVDRLVGHLHPQPAPEPEYSPDPFARVMHRDSASGIVEQLREAKTEREARAILAIVPPFRLALVADELGVAFGEDDSADKTRADVISKLGHLHPGGGDTTPDAMSDDELGAALREAPPGSPRAAELMREAGRRLDARRPVAPAAPAPPTAGAATPRPFPPGQHSWSGHDGKDVTDEENLSPVEGGSIETLRRLSSGVPWEEGGQRGTYFGTRPDSNLDLPQPRIDEIRAAIEDISDRHAAPGTGYLQLSTVREELGGRFPRGEVDRVLQLLNRSGDWYLATESNQKALRPRDRLAGVVLGIGDKHVLKVQRRMESAPRADLSVSRDERIRQLMATGLTRAQAQARLAGEDLNLPEADNEARLNLSKVEQARTIGDLRALARDVGARVPSTARTHDQIRAFLRLLFTMRPGETPIEYGERIRRGRTTRNDDMDAEMRDRVLALAEVRFADEIRAMDDNQLKRYWTVGEGLKRWRFSPHPWTKLRNLLRKHVGPGRAERMASEWFHVVFGYWPGSRKGDNPVGPG